MDDRDRYARGSDPETSKEAAELVDLTVHERDWRSVKGWLNRSADGCGTMRELGAVLADKGYYESWETGRRRIRTMQAKGLLERARDATGKKIRHKNVDGRMAECLRLPHPPAPVINMPHVVGQDPTGPSGASGADRGGVVPGDVQVEEVPVPPQQRFLVRRRSGEGRQRPAGSGPGGDQG